MKDTTAERNTIVKVLLEKTKETMNLDSLDEETTRMVEILVVLRISTKHINLWMRQLEMKRKEISELAQLVGVEEVKREIIGDSKRQVTRS